jgi:hypothetical protein
MRILPFAVFLFGVLATPISTSCVAEYGAAKAEIVLFDNGPMNHANGLQVTLSELAEDFELPFAADITSAKIGISDFGGDSFPGGVTDHNLTTQVHVSVQIVRS